MSEEYKEDSTRGKSVINPLNYKGDVLVQVWMDSRILASMSNWLDSREMYTRFMSQVVRRSMEEFCYALMCSHGLNMIEHTGDARRLLEAKYGVNLKTRKQGKGGKNTLHNLILSDRKQGRSESLKSVSPEQLQKMTDHMQSLIDSDVTTPAPEKPFDPYDPNDPMNAGGVTPDVIESKVTLDD